MRRYLKLTVAGALTLSLAALPDPAAAQLTTAITVDTNAVANSLAIPIITRLARDPLGYAATVVNITNTKDIQFGVAGPVFLHFEVISGDDGDPAGHTHTNRNDFWTSQDSVCIATPGETTQITFEPTSEGSVMMFECSHPTATPGAPGDHGVGNGFAGKSFQQMVSVRAKSGILWVTQETFPFSGVYMDGDILEGRAHVLEFTNGSAYSLDAIPFNALADFNGSDGEWRFDGREFPNAPLSWVTSVILPAANVQARLLLFSLDGNLANSGVGGPNPRFEYAWYDDDENRQTSDHFEFDCFAWVDLDTDLEVTAANAGTPTGNLRLRHVTQTHINDAVHDANHEALVSDNQRVYPFYGYLVTHINMDAAIQKTCVAPADAGNGANGTGAACSIGATVPMSNAAATAHLLTADQNALIPTTGDRPVMTRN